MTLPSRRVLERLWDLAINANIYPAEGVFTRPSIGPAPFYDRYGRQFVWDVPFSGLAVAVVGGRPDLARGFVQNLFDFQVGDGPDTGMVPRLMHRDGHTSGQDGSQAPMLAWLVAELHRIDQDPEFVRWCYPRLAAHVRWWRGPRRDVDADGLSEYAGSTATFAAYESGHDFSPERDLVMHGPCEPGLDGLVHEPIADLTLNVYLYAELRAMAELAEVVESSDAPAWTQQADALGARINEAMWDEATGRFLSCVRRDLVAAQPRVHRTTAAILMPLWAGLATTAQAEATMRVLTEQPEDYPQRDGTMEIRFSSGDDLFLGSHVVTTSLHPSAGSGEAAGGVWAGPVERTADGWCLAAQAPDDRLAWCEWGGDRYVPRVHFNRLGVEVDVLDDNNGSVAVELATDGEPLRLLARKEGTGAWRTFEATFGAEPLVFERPGLHGLRGLIVRDAGTNRADLTVRAVRLHWWRLERRGLLTPYGIASVHPLDGKHPAPGAPTHFWSGTIWGPHQLHGCLGLARYGNDALAEAIAEAYLQTQVRAFASGGDAYEHHDFRDGRGMGTGHYTWGVAVACYLYDKLVEPGSLSGTNALPTKG